MKHIVHLEDNEDYQFYVDTMLKDFVNVTAAYTAKEFWEGVAGCKFDMFILDLVLSDGSGARIAKEARSKFPNIPIVMLSAHDIIADFVDVADATFVKTTLDLEEFAATIKEMLNKTG